MSKCYKYAVKIEAGQVMRPDEFPPPSELVCIHVAKVLDQAALRDCVTRIITLIPGTGVMYPVFAFEGVTDFDIAEVRLVSRTDSLLKPRTKNLKLFVKLRYKILYSDGFNKLSVIDEAGFNITVNEIYCPSCLTQISSIKYPDEQVSSFSNEDGLLIKVEAIADAFNDAICVINGALALDVGVFFVIKCECIVQLLVPSYGYCPVPPEQSNITSQNCSTFNNKIKTPFPRQFFPVQKFNPLDVKLQSKNLKEEL
ncbi:hypothetical protein DFR58_102265 [Anaerobacterium chartisolvens]|uniref:Uncharacterized protein n=1 Tax=Anaerobacterium chartisolvens TaxID=1297424 RepID=A0A369BF94_9FIRM|nr:hypothetical protein [Anaerobacterium chartisolvens]RCX20192.1 hypothetical protein DFR58_102265 [Anaerobacterium chartisolvens]